MRILVTSVRSWLLKLWQSGSSTVDQDEKNAFFGRYGPEIKIRSRCDLLIKFSRLDCSLPDRTKGRRTHHEERFDIKHYIMILAGNDRLSYPFTLKKRESPDFVSCSLKDTIGIECTNADTQEYQQALTEAERDKSIVLIEPSHFKSSYGSLQRGAYKRALKKMGNKLNGPGWRGNEAEQEWVQIIVNTIEEKVSKLNKPYFKHFKKNALLIYDNSPVSFVSNDDILPLLNRAIREYYTQNSNKVLFDAISILRNKSLICWKVGEEIKVLEN